MDPLTLVASVMPFLVRSVKDAADDAVRGIWRAVKAKFADDHVATGALDRLEQQPDNPRRQAAVEDHLAEKAAADPDLLAVLAELVGQAQSHDISDVTITDAGATSIGGDVAISAGGHAAGRDLTIGS